MLENVLLPDGDTTQLYVHRWGEKTASRTVVCVHGLTRNGLDFEPLAVVLASQGFQVIAPDMPGRGKSPWLTNPLYYNNVVNASLCIQLLAKLKLTRVSWVGTSMGGLIAMMVANQLPTLISRLALNDVGCVVPAEALKRIGEYVGDSPVHATFEAAEAQLKLRTEPFAIPAYHWKRFADHSIEKIEGGYRLAYDPAIAQSFQMGEAPKDIELWPMWELMKTIPTLLIRGARSDLLTEEVAKNMKSTHPFLTRYTVPEAGHAPSLTSDAEIQTIFRFLQGS